MLRSIGGEQSEESVESVLKKKRRHVIVLTTSL